MISRESIKSKVRQVYKVNTEKLTFDFKDFIDLETIYHVHYFIYCYSRGAHSCA